MSVEDFVNSAYYLDLSFNFVRCVMIMAHEIFFGLPFKLLFFPAVFVYFLVILSKEEKIDIGFLTATVAVFVIIFYQLYILLTITPKSDISYCITCVDFLFEALQFVADKASVVCELQWLSPVVVRLTVGIIGTLVCMISMMAACQQLAFTMLSVADNDQRKKRQ